MIFDTFPIKSTICGCNATLVIKSDGFRIENPSVFIVITIDRLEAVAVICGNRVIPFQQQKTFQKDSCEQIKVHCESQRFLKHRLSSSSQARTLCGLSFVICRLQNSQSRSDEYLSCQMILGEPAYSLYISIIGILFVTKTSKLIENFYCTSTGAIV